MNLKTQKMLRTVSLLLAIAVVFTSGCQQQKPDASKELKPLADKFVEVWNNGNLEDLDAIIDPSFVRTENEAPEVSGLEGLKKVMTGYRTAYPDIKIVSEEEIYAENKATVRWRFTGTNSGPGEIPPTGIKVEFWGETILHFSNGKLTAEIVAFDQRPVLEQLGYTITPPVFDKK